MISVAKFIRDPHQYYSLTHFPLVWQDWGDATKKATPCHFYFIETVIKWWFDLPSVAEETNVVRAVYMYSKGSDLSGHLMFVVHHQEHSASVQTVTPGVSVEPPQWPLVVNRWTNSCSQMGFLEVQLVQVSDLIINSFLFYIIIFLHKKTD